MKKNGLIVSILLGVIILGIFSTFVILKSEDDCNLPIALINGKNSEQVIKDLNVQGIYFDENYPVTLNDIQVSSQINSFVKSYCD